ncbi:TonB-dependent receptor domain-containing protein [Sphingomonas lenta]|nr:TonB-dependent receptor [Sphingomonas lenta]
MRKQRVESTGTSNAGMSNGGRRAAFLMGAGVLALLASPALAQTDPPPSPQEGQTGAGVAGADAAAAQPNSTDTGPDSAQIGDIVVTAQRREESLQRVPLSITAVSGEALKQANVTDINRIEQIAPGVRIGRSGSDARPAIRGVFTEAIGANSDPRIGFYIDDIYQSRTSQALAAFVDLERVEVQKGPQGTLYGRNSFGGNIAIYSATPKDEFSAGVDALYGRFNRARVEGFVNVPLTDGIAARVAGAYEYQDGYVKNTSTGDDLGDEDAAFVRGILRVAPPESDLEIQLLGSYYRQGGNGISAFGYKSIGTLADPSLVRGPGGSITLPGGRVLTFPNGFNGTAFPSTFANPIPVPFNSRFRDGVPDVAGGDIGVPIERDPYRINFDADVRRKTEQTQFSALINYDIGPVRFRSISSYTDFYALRQSDNDFSPAPIAVDSNLTKVQTITQELQLLSNDTTSPFQWIIGGFYYDDDVEEIFFSDNFVPGYPVAGQPSLSLFSNTLLPGGAFPNNTPIASNRSDNFSPVRVRTKSYAGFVQASYTLFDSLRFTAGYRRTSDRKRYAAGVGQGAQQNPATPTVAPYFVFDLNQPVNYACNPAGGTQLGGNNPAQPGSTALNSANGIGINCGRAKFDFDTWRGAVDYQITPDNMIYASVSKGVRSGGFNNVLAPAGTPGVAPGEVLPFAPEEVTAYEVGFKNRFAGDTVQLNLAFFYNDFTDLQVQTSVPAPNGLTVLSIITNAGKSRAYGVEIDGIFKPVPELTFQAAFNYLNAKDTDFVTGTFGNGLCAVVAGGCPAPAALPAGATAAQIAAYNAQLNANAFGIGPQGAPFPNPVTDPARFQQVFLSGGVAAAQGGNLPVYNYIIAGRLADGRKVKSQTPLSPEYTIQLGVAYDIDLGGGRLTPSVQSYFSSDFINTAFTPNFGRQDAFTRTDLRLTFLTADERLTLQAFVENLENTAVLNRVAFGGNRSLNGVYGLPRTYGVKAGIRF